MQRYFTKDNNFTLYDSDKHHIQKVMRNQIGDKIEIVNDNKAYLARLTNIDNVSFDIIKELSANPELPIHVTMAIGLVTEQKWDLIIQKMTELGVSRIIPLKMERSIVKLDDKKISKKQDRWQTICKEASEQSKRLTIPEITKPMTLKELTELSFDLKLVSSVKESENSLNNSLQNIGKYATMIVVVGPEGGIAPSEEDYLTNQGYQRVSLGKRVLRVETATFYIASAISYSSMR